MWCWRQVGACYLQWSPIRSRPYHLYFLLIANLMDPNFTIVIRYSLLPQCCSCKSVCCTPACIVCITTQAAVTQLCLYQWGLPRYPARLSLACLANLRFFFPLLYFVLLLLPSSTRLQWWHSADSERHQPRNHPGTKDQGQVWAGGILSREYWRECRARHINPATHKHTQEGHMDWQTCSHSQTASAHTAGIKYIQYTLSRFTQSCSTYINQQLYSDAAPHTGARLQTASSTDPLKVADRLSLCVAHVFSLCSYSFRHLTLPQATWLFKCHHTTWVFVSQKERDSTRETVYVCERERDRECFFFFLFFSSFSGKKLKKKYIHTKPEVPSEEFEVYL